MDFLDIFALDSIILTCLSFWQDCLCSHLLPCKSPAYDNHTWNYVVPYRCPDKTNSNISQYLNHVNICMWMNIFMNMYTWASQLQHCSSLSKYYQTGPVPQKICQRESCQLLPEGSCYLVGQGIVATQILSAFPSHRRQWQAVSTSQFRSQVGENGPSWYNV